MAQGKQIRNGNGKRRIAKKKRRIGFNKKAAKALIREIYEQEILWFAIGVLAIFMLVATEFSFQSRFTAVKIKALGGQTGYSIIKELNPNASDFDIFQMKARFAISHLNDSNLKAGKEYIFFQPINETSDSK